MVYGCDRFCDCTVFVYGCFCLCTIGSARQYGFVCPCLEYDDAPAASGDDPPILAVYQLGWVDSYLPLVVPPFGASAFLIFLLRQFYLGISRDLDEAVKIDGGGYVTMYFRIILPLSIPALATAAILEFMFRWNDLMGPLIYLHSPEKYSMSLGLANLPAEFGATPWNLLMAASVMAVTPPLILFFLSSKTFYSRVCHYRFERVILGTSFVDEMIGCDDDAAVFFYLLLLCEIGTVDHVEGGMT